MTHTQPIALKRLNPLFIDASVAKQSPASREPLARLHPAAPRPHRHRRPLYFQPFFEPAAAARPQAAQVVRLPLRRLRGTRTRAAAAIQERPWLPVVALLGGGFNRTRRNMT